VTRLIIADDEELIRTGLRLILDREPDLVVVAEASSGLQALQAHRDTPADLVLMDLRMPGMDGVEATRQFVALADRSPRILVLTTFGSEELVYAALKAGASGFLLKTTPQPTWSSHCAPSPPASRCCRRRSRAR
jgi:DNA-binding NarL/FixJ family response regulator